jgi:hypothetical protein
MPSRLEEGDKCHAKAKWVIKNQELELATTDGLTIIPSAEDVFASEFGQTKSIQGHRISTIPSKAFPKLRFSKFPLELCVRIETIEEKESENLVCLVYGKHREVESSIPELFSRNADHLIINGTWFPFVKGGLREVRRVLADCGIDQTGPISLRQYLCLITCRDLSGI